jgi:hypothetical protein
MTSTETFSHSWPVGRYTATLIVNRHPQGHLTSHCDWQPYFPKRMGNVMQAQFTAGLCIAVARVRAQMNQPVEWD